MPEDWSVKYDSGFGGSDATSLVNGFRTFPMTWVSHARRPDFDYTSVKTSEPQLVLFAEVLASVQMEMLADSAVQ